MPFFTFESLYVSVTRKNYEKFKKNSALRTKIFSWHPQFFLIFFRNPVTPAPYNSYDISLWKSDSHYSFQICTLCRQDPCLMKISIIWEINSQITFHFFEKSSWFFMTFLFHDIWWFFKIFKPRCLFNGSTDIF